MPWFPQLCRNLGLTVHHIVKPADAPRKQVVNQTVEEQQVSDTVTLRRTTVEEIEVKPVSPKSASEAAEGAGGTDGPGTSGESGGASR